MKIKVLRRFYIIRLALSFVIDYWKISLIHKRLQGEKRDIAVNRIHKKAGIRYRITASRLKGIIVKIGQFLSMRQDILPQAFTKELQDLQDALPPSPSESIQRLLEKENVQSIFKEFDTTAIAAASLAQVHKAVLNDGTVVAVKIIRPGMAKLARIDLSTIGLAVKVVQKIPALNRKMNFIEMHREFTETIERELDCDQEINHMLRFEDMFSNNNRIKIPKVFKDLSTPTILVMEFMEGARITNHNMNIDTVMMGETILDAYFKQLLVFGFIHVDPHPGNLLLLPDHRLCFLDFGMIDELTVEEIQTLRSLFRCIMFRDLEGVLTAFEELGFLPKDADRKELLPMLSQLLDRLDGAIEHQSKQEFKHVISGLKYFINKSPIQLQAKYMFLLRGAGMLITVLNELAPRTNWFEILFRIGPATFSSPIQTSNSIQANGDYK
ncbi:ABC1 kinase family protein [Bacillus sp. Marseille-P3661]|uniref:ABC1 kinase family protein n=1 Tax=Bacillus sp. Marseille-P3661 TaxID=1936234 RepID=UPI000C84E4C0|nr:AarF/UbiB family protein [Bacillus sp. Marseille-P3661]